jgi:hypothetical protein
MKMPPLPTGRRAARAEREGTCSTGAEFHHPTWSSREGGPTVCVDHEHYRTRFS